MNDEAELTLRLQRGDERALKELYDRLGGNVFALALQMLGSREDAQEIVQDAFVNLYNGARRFDPSKGSLRAYLYTIARNACRMRLRARGSRPSSAGEIDLHEADAPFAAPGSDGDHVERITVQQAFAMLEADEIALLEAAFFQGYSHAEIAERTDTPLGTVKSRIRRAMLKLREGLGGV